MANVAVKERKAPKSDGTRWLDRDWLARSISLAVHHADLSGDADISSALLALHQAVIARRDQA